MIALKTNILLLATLCAKLAMADEDIVIPTKSGCTSTMTFTQSRLPTPPFWPQCSWNGTVTAYPSTVTVTGSVDCDGCTDVRIVQVPIVHCPVMIISTVIRVSTPSTLYRTVCSATPTPEVDA
ncbi:hypothetical protein TrVGV298_008463 [Trichoderma virens]|nr:hypothetical protein TrVGV298_008463 [Trichoderma virens]